MNGSSIIQMNWALPSWPWSYGSWISNNYASMAYHH